MKKKQIITTCCVAAAILVGVFVWQAYFSATKIAFVNFQTINLGNISNRYNGRPTKVYQCTPPWLPIPQTISATSMRYR